MVDPIALLTVGGPILVGLVGAVYTFRLGKANAQKEMQGSVQAGFQMLVKELQEERVELSKVIDKQAEQLVNNAEQIARLRSEVGSLRDELELAMKRWRRGDEAPQLENRV